jgi:hypothetical protein
MLTALLASIAKWEDNTKITHISEAEIWGDTCALCKEATKRNFLDEDKDFCTSCPVYERTGHVNCKETPWEEIPAIVGDVKSLSAPLSVFHCAAQDEVDFLKSLLPEDQS